MSDKKNTEIAVNEGFAALANRDVLNEAMADDCQGLEFSFDRVKLPAGGGTAFEIPSAESEESEMAKDITGVIVYNHPAYAYYHDKYTGGNNPPDCGSFDGVTGEGDPGGSCAACQLNRFGTGENGGKACKKRRRIYVLREGEIFPLLLSLPTGSLKEFTKYIKRLLGKGRKSNSVVTRFSLRKATNSGGLAYSQAQFSIDRALTPQEYALLEKLSEQVKAYSKRVGFEVDNTVEPDAEEEPLVDPDTGEVIEPLR